MSRRDDNRERRVRRTIRDGVNEVIGDLAAQGEGHQDARIKSRCLAQDRRRIEDEVWQVLNERFRIIDRDRRERP